MEELKTCPFCGEKVSISIAGDGYDFWWKITHGKDKCKCYVMESEKFYSFGTEEKKALIDKWNRMADDGKG